MDDNITRRKFVKVAAGTALFCSYYPLNSLAVSSKAAGKENLVGACGIYCGICPSYINKQGEDKQIKMRLEKGSSGLVRSDLKWFVDFMNKQRCDGCLSGGKLAGHCQNCDIRLCALKKEKTARCTDCKELPCDQFTKLVNMGNYEHRKEYQANLIKLKKMTAKELAEQEEKRWSCPKCGQPVSWYDTECVVCGAPRAGHLFPVPEK